MIEQVSVAEVKNKFSEYVAKVAHTNQHYLIITKRNKPIAALVDLATLKRVEKIEGKQGLASVIGRWKNFDEIYPEIENAIQTRSKDRLRDVSI